jgi:hypothetical protein
MPRNLGNSNGSRIAVFNSGGSYIGEVGSAASTPGGEIGSSIAKMGLNE